MGVKNMKKYRKMEEDLNKEFNDLKENLNEIQKRSENFIFINEKRLENFNKLDEIIENIDKEFAEKTGIFNKKDQIFLWTAVALQTLRWYLLEYDFGEWTVDKDSREKASEGGKREEAARKNYLNENKDNNKNSNNFIPWTDYFKNAVPYDAMKDDKSNMEGVKNIIIEGVTAFGKNLSPSKHHSATLGHDPILGYFFGTINIMTSTITYNKTLFPTNKVEYPLIKEKVEFLETFFTSVRAGIDDYKRIPAALIRQAMHVSSDTFSTMGLPIPFLNATTQQKFLEQGWNSNELVKNLGKFKDALAKNMTVFLLQLLISYFINIVIGNLHLLFYDEEKDGNLDLYNIRTQKIIATSSTISSALNIGYIGAKIYVGCNNTNINSIKDGIKKIDLGGYINTVHQIVKSKRLQERIRREYLEEKLYEKFLIEMEGDKNE
jgi:putative uncharacterized protein (fragment)